MITFIKISWRNIIRNKKRSLITISAVGFGLGALIFIWAFVDGAHKQMIENYTSLLTGHIEIHKAGYQQKQQLETFIDNPDEIIDKLKDNKNITSLSKRIKAFGLVSSTEFSSGVLILGVDAALEKKVGSLYKKIVDGQFLGEEGGNDIVIGQMLAKNLNVTIGDKIVIMSQALDGSIAAGAFHVKGLFDTGTEEIDKGLVLIDYKACQELFVMDGKTTEIAINLKEVSTSVSEASLLAKQFDPRQIEVLSWEQVSPIFKQWIEFDNAFVWIIVIVVMIVVAIGILNTVLMGVLERVREFGILLAIGTKRKQVVAMVAWESLFLGLIGSISGLILGCGLSFYFGNVGIDLTRVASALNSFYIDSLVYPILDVSHLIFSTSLVLLTSIIVSIYPAWYASKLNPVDAIRKI